VAAVLVTSIAPTSVAVKSAAPKSVALNVVELEPVLFPATANADGAIPPAVGDATAGGGTTIEGLMPELLPSTDVSGSAPSTNAVAAFGSGAATESAGLPGMIGLQMLDKDIVPNAGVEPAGVGRMMPLAASNAAVVGVLVGDIAMPEAGQAVIAPSGPICVGAARLPRLRKMPPIDSVTIPGRAAAVGMPG
jgi:hypothetical protein